MAEDKYCWSVATTKLLISQYESYEMLYNTKHVDYKNRNERLEAYNKMAQAINVIQDGCTASDIKKKLNGLRSQYFAEKMKVSKSLKSGTVGDEYVPTIYWYPLLKFLDTGTNADDSQTNLDSTIFEMTNGTVEEKILPTSSTWNFNVTPAINIQSNDSESPKFKKHKSDKSSNSLMLNASNSTAEMSNFGNYKPTIQQTEDAINTFGKFVASELLSIHNSSSDYVCRQAKRKIQQILLDTWDMIDSTDLALKQRLL